MTDAELKLPRWKCHKEVEAARIDLVRYLQPTAADDIVNDHELERWHQAHGGALLCLAVGVELRVPLEYIRKHQPKAGGYFVRYADGYQSYSPAEAFEAGYTLVDPT